MLRHGGLFLCLVFGFCLGSVATLFNIGMVSGMLIGLRIQVVEDELRRLKGDLQEPLLTVPSRVSPTPPHWHDAIPEPPLVPPILEAPGQLPEPTPTEPSLERSRNFVGVR